MRTKPRIQGGNQAASPAAIHTACWLAAFVPGKALPDWLQQALHPVRDRASAEQLPAVVVPGAAGESLVVVTLRDFLPWLQARSQARPSSPGEEQPCRKRA